MGIRESLGQIDPNEQERLHNFSIEESQSETELPFDPETEISDRDWQNIKAELKACRSEGMWREFDKLAANIKTLFPDRVAELNLDEKT